MKLSCTPISYADELGKGNMDTRGFIDTCAELGFDGVDMLEPNRYKWLWGKSPADSATVRKWIAEAGIELAAYGCGNNFARPDAAERAAQVDAVKVAITEAAELGAPVLRIFGGRIEPGVTPHDGVQWVKQGIADCLAHAEKNNVILGLENHGALPGHGFELKAIIESFDSPFVRCTYDSGNFIANNMLEVEDPIRALEMVLPLIAHVHVKDFGPHRDPSSGRRAEARVAGEGDVPLRQVTAMLVQSGYKGFYTLEYEAAAICPEREGVARSFTYLDGLRKLHHALGLGQ